jgi:hypothetical protein
MATATTSYGKIQEKGLAMKLTPQMRAKLPAKYFGLPSTRDYPMAVIVGGQAKWDKQHAALAKGRAKQQLERGYIKKTQYSQIIRKADRVLAMKNAKSYRKNTAVRMQKDFDDPEWKTFSRKAIKKRKARKTNPKKYDQETIAKKVLHRIPESTILLFDPRNHRDETYLKMQILESYPKHMKNRVLSNYNKYVDDVYNYLVKKIISKSNPKKRKTKTNPKRYTEHEIYIWRVIHIPPKPSNVNYVSTRFATYKDASKFISQLKNKGIKRIQLEHTLKGLRDDWEKINGEWIKYISNYKRKTRKTRKNTTVPTGSSTGGGYMHAMRGLREGDYSTQRRGKQLHMDYLPVGYSTETGRDVVDTALVAGKPLKRKKRTNPRKKGWFKFGMFAKSGKKLGVRIGHGTKTEADKAGKRFLGKKVNGRIVHRIVVDGPLKNKPMV